MSIDDDKRIGATNLESISRALARIVAIERDNEESDRSSSEERVDKLQPELERLKLMVAYETKSMRLSWYSSISLAVLSGGISALVSLAHMWSAIVPLARWNALVPLAHKWSQLFAESELSLSLGFVILGSFFAFSTAKLLSTWRKRTLLRFLDAVVDKRIELVDERTELRHRDGERVSRV